MITLRELAAWEDRLGRLVGALDGDCLARDEQLARLGVFAEYAAVFSSYVRLAEPEEPEGADALARATFLSWWAVAEPSCVTGLGDLPESQVRELHERLDSACRCDGLPAELRWMLPHYHARTALAFLRFPGLPALERFLAEADPEAWRAHADEARAMADRGALGAYWRARAKRA